MYKLKLEDIASQLKGLSEGISKDIFEKNHLDERADKTTVSEKTAEYNARIFSTGQHADDVALGACDLLTHMSKLCYRISRLFQTPDFNDEHSREVINAVAWIRSNATEFKGLSGQLKTEICNLMKPLLGELDVIDGMMS